MRTNPLCLLFVVPHFYSYATVYLNSDIFKHETNIPPPTYGVDYTGIQYPTAFKRVVNFLSATAKDEIEFGLKSQLTKWKGSGREFKERLLNEVQRYARHQYPYNQPHKGVDVMSWWRAIEGQECAEVLPVSYSRLFLFIT